ncbi:Oxysterol-binding protein-domain-containing protein [Irpex rosettiformis]|uniref:Oxysterol-binding protein-domain-containing protein n=1 Tax=Irpex rosettiformis TaxID=378272 RepID=A0ACB8U657_9APHY|nr:Oxysterol-binding protein-domain-containing protein [Irpex rosettiformis]
MASTPTSSMTIPARHSSSTTPKGTTPTSGGHDALYQVRLLSALRSGDPAQIHPFLTELGRDRRKSGEDTVDLGAAALHLAIRCASTDTVALLLGHRSISPNAIYPSGSGTTALHLAASLPRMDVLLLLLEQEGIDDTIRDSQGRTCLEVAKGRDVIRAIKESRAELNSTYQSWLRVYVNSSPNERPPEALIRLLSSPRIRLVDLSHLDESQGTTLLHEAVKRKDLRMVELAVRAGADVFVRDRKGRMAGDGHSKDDRVKVFLRQFTNQDTSLLRQLPSTEPPEMRGYLNKYTNVAKGYSTRWFVLKDGVLSYFHHQEDEQVASRGSIAMKSAVLKSTPGSGGLRFEVHSMPTRGNSIQKWYVKANHPVEASRWMQALTKSIQWAQREAERPSVDTLSEVSSVLAPSTRPGSFTSHSRKRSGKESTVSSVAPDDTQADTSPKASVDGGDDGNAEKSSSSVAESEHNPPYHLSFELHANSTIAQMDLTAEMLQTLPVTAAGEDAKSAMADSLNSVQNMVHEYVTMVREREEWWKEKLERERERQNVWEESLQAVVKEGELMERELRTKSRRRSRMFTDVSSFQTASEFGTLRARPSTLPLTSPATVVESPEPTPTPAAIVPLDLHTPSAAPVPPPPAGLPTDITPPPPTITINESRVTTPTERNLTINRKASVRRQLSVSSPPPRPFSLIMSTSPDNDDEEAIDTDEEDEFFDAIESNAIPNLIVADSLAGKSVLEMPRSVDQSQFVGYTHLRTRLSITSDDRPPMSLWAVLKNSIGKDLTKISFPVFFNEPTSMLQRMAEDMEFSECLDAAAVERDPHRRIAYVAAFAMSNYSSTIGRIAKPFNPMLSETFEYVQIEKKYRYMSEQVSHHPPISACWAESPVWRYYGEVDAQNKFMGKSFEIRPTGVAHAELLLPSDWAPKYPISKDSVLPDRVKEHYSWKKVTTNISGFILGSPTIDHYGDMHVVNHRTGDRCVLTFKPRGWRGRDAFEISGYVSDGEGNITYEIAGRWNSQLVARAVGTGVGSLHPDVAVNSPQSSEFFLLWRNSVKPPAPFNLTPYAITLNDCPEGTLKPYLCPTDCRLRPDQRAFELGRYEYANSLKNKQEEFQRAIRKAREEGKLPPHRPRWFTAETEPDTGERVWSPARIDNRLEYWIEREKVWNAKTSGLDAGWRDVDRIFIDDKP